MSGFEVAGVVLGALPVIFAAVDLSKKSIGRGAIFFRKRHYVEKLALALLSQRQHLTEIIRSILIGSGCEDLSRFDSDPVGYLKDDAVQGQVLEHLGEENFAVLGGQILHCQEIIKQVAIKTANLVPGIQGPSDDLMQIIEENRRAKTKQLEVVPRVKLMFKTKEFEEITKDLDDTTNSLFRLTTLVSSNRQAAGINTSKHALGIAKSLRRAHQSASNLYTAISRAWNGDCHQGHETRLFLEDRILDRSSGRKSANTPLTFPLVFATMPSERKRVWHEAVVRVLHNDEDHEQPPAPTQAPSPPQRVAFVVTSADLTCPKPQIIPVENICAVIPSRHISFVLTGQPKIGLMISDGPSPGTSAAPSKASLKEILSAPRKIPTSLRLRMLLALRVASNLLQLLQTRWLPHSWSDEQVFFPLTRTRPTTSGQGASLDIDFGRPFILAPFPQGCTAATQPQPQADPKLALLELGILLLEIWYEETLEAHFSLDRHPTEFYERLTWAHKWLDEMTNPPPELYDRAVSHCIKGVIGGEVRLGQWEDGELWNAICGDVIVPLFNNCKMWR